MFPELLASYDAGGPLYWKEWLAEPLQIPDLVRLLALHLVGEMPIATIELSESERNITQKLPISLRALRRLGEWGELEAEIQLAIARSGKFGGLPLTGSADPSAIVSELLKLRGHLIPQSLKAFLDRIEVPPKTPKRATGRPPKYDWATIQKKLEAKLRDDGCPAPGEQVSLEKWVADRFPPDQQPSTSVIRKHVVAAIERHRQEIG